MYSIRKKMKNKKFLDEILLVFLMVMVFSVPLMTEANVETKDAKGDVKEKAKRDAENDAKMFNELKWFAGGFLGSALPCLSFFALLYSDAHGVYLEDDIPRFLGPDTLYICCFSVIGTGTLLPTVYAVFRSPMPPAEKFLGKSSDYINAYTTAYKRRIKRQRIALSTMGCIVGTCVGMLSLRLVPETYDKEE